MKHRMKQKPQQPVVVHLLDQQGNLTSSETIERTTLHADKSDVNGNISSPQTPLNVLVTSDISEESNSDLTELSNVELDNEIVGDAEADTNECSMAPTIKPKVCFSLKYHLKF